jgi:hypothetical protein
VAARLMQSQIGLCYRCSNLTEVNSMPGRVVKKKKKGKHPITIFYCMLGIPDNFKNLIEEN